MFLYAAAVTDQECAAPEAGRSPGRPSGLRERKKLATRQALGVAAMRLAVQRGLDNVLVEDIAAAADVSPRTFNNYFASKYEAICALAVDRSYWIGEALRERPAGEGLWDAVCGAVRTVYAVAALAPDPQLIAGIRLVTSSPVLRGEYLKGLAVMQYELAGAIAERAGGELAGRPAVSRALAGALTSALQAATEAWLFADPPVALAPLIEDALAELAAGLREILPAGPARRVRPAENHAPPAAASG
jgi:AcrR family transcriptional regulator